MAGLKNYEVRDDLLRKLGIESVGSASAAMIEDVRNAFNYAQQTLWMAGPDYFNRTQIDVALVAGTSEYALADSVQSVLGPVRLPSGRTLRALESRSELDNFGLLYLGQTSPTVASGTPLAYFVEGLYQAGNDPVRLRLHLVPAPDVTAASGNAVVEGVSECTLFSTADVAGTSTLPVAQQYVETLFLPLARKAISRSVYFSAVDTQEKIDADFKEAMTVLGRAGGFPPAAGRRAADAREVEA
jgi:hypothetical protein